MKYLKLHFKFSEFSTGLWKKLWKTLSSESGNEAERVFLQQFRAVGQSIA
jgi:hypothetical protein